MTLASGSEPLRLRDGRIVLQNGEVVDQGRMVEVPTHQEARRIVTATRRKMSDLPALPKQMNAVGAVLSYTLFGLDDEEIAVATGITVDQVGRVKMSDPYTQMYDAVVRTILDSETDVVRELLAKNAKRAANTMVEALDAGSRSDRMAAARDILDRSGHRPADVVEHRHRVDGGLVIEYVKREADMPMIDMGGV